MKIKKLIAIILAVVLVATMTDLPVMATESPQVTTGTAVYSEGKMSFPELTVTGSGIMTVLISFSDAVTAGDKINLPVSPSGFTVSASSSSNNYTKRINLTGSVSAETVQEYLRGVTYTVAGASQKVNITVTTDNITSDTFYNSETGHYYQYITAGSSGINWTDAYAAARSMTYMGRTGYLATVTAKGEDVFLNSLSGGKTGWLGGTIMNNTGGRVDASLIADSLGQYYSGFIDSVVSTGWYWACGPEIGTVFYSVNSTKDMTGATDAIKTANADAIADAANPGTYYNWPRNGANEPNNSGTQRENCLTTLTISGLTGKQGTAFSWNDIRYNNTDQTSQYSAKGYFVEYGNKITGDSGTGISSYSTVSGSLSGIPVLTAGTVSRTSNTQGTVKFTSDRSGAYFYSVTADGASEPVINTSGAGTACTAGENTIINPTGLAAGAKDMFIKVRDDAGKFSNVLKIDIDSYNNAPSFVSGTASIVIDSNSVSNNITSYLHAGDMDSGQILTWTQKSAPAHGTLVFLDAMATSQGTDIAPTGSVKYTPEYNFAGNDSFVVQVSDGVLTAECTVSVQVIDRIAPTATVKEGSNQWTAFQNTVTFGLFFRDTVGISVVGADEGGSGLKDIEYYKSNSQLTLQDVKNLTGWNIYSGAISVSPVDLEKFIIYVKVTDNAGNYTIISSDGMKFDLQGPLLSTNYTKDSKSMEVTVSDSGSGVASVSYSIAGKSAQTASPVGGKITILALEDGRYDVIITARDNIGNESSLTVNVVSLHNVVFMMFEGDMNAALRTETVEYAKSATAPTEPVRTGYTFKSWNKGFDNVTSDMTVSALWNISGCVVTPYLGMFDGNAHASVSVTGTLPGDVITYSTDGNVFKAECPQIKDKGNCAVTVKVERSGCPAWTSEVRTAVVTASEITADMIADIPSAEYSGQANTPAVKVTSRSTVLIKTTDYTVSYSDNIKAGSASVIVSGCGNYTGTVIKHFAVYAKDTGVKIANADTPQVKATGLENLYKDNVIYTAADQLVEKNGGTVKIELSVQTGTDLATDVKKIADLAPDRTIGLYLDISLFKTVTVAGETSATTTRISTLKEVLSVIIPIPDNLRNRNEIVLYRVHDGIASVIPVGSNNAVNGEYCIIGTDSITLYVSNFSTYAIGYVNPVEKDITPVNTPVTGDASKTAPAVIIWLGSATVISILGVASRRKKRKTSI